MVITLVSLSIYPFPVLDLIKTMKLKQNLSMIFKLNKSNLTVRNMQICITILIWHLIHEKIIIYYN